MTNMNDVFVKVDSEKMIVTNEKSNKGVSVSVILAPPHFLFSLKESSQKCQTTKVTL